MCLSSQTISLIMSNFREPFELIHVHEFSERGSRHFSAMLEQFLSDFIHRKNSCGTLPNNVGKTYGIEVFRQILRYFSYNSKLNLIFIAIRKILKL